MASSKRVRLDKLLVDSGYFDSRQRAQRAILAGDILVAERVFDKPGSLVRPDAPIRVVATERYVSRGGYKMEAALDRFGIDPAGRRCLDIGASTGGFTDCLLQRGASEVAAVDVGHNQLAWKMRSDSRVKVFEGINARFLSAELFGANFSLAVADVSFISLTLVLGPMFECLDETGEIVVLIKPQFELDAKRVDKGGIVRSAINRAAAVERIQNFVTGQLGRQWLGVIESPILGAKGNQEFLAWLR
ncbi:MAG TPA: TlyA family RNA methyltransferase [Chthoniobacterales bacterium]|nr:TlyA family RNA methyltransferase [Chthoniobacterales bacterium]